MVPMGCNPKVRDLRVRTRRSRFVAVPPLMKIRRGFLERGCRTGSGNSGDSDPLVVNAPLSIEGARRAGSRRVSNRRKIWRAYGTIDRCLHWLNRTAMGCWSAGRAEGGGPLWSLWTVLAVTPSRAVEDFSGQERDWALWKWGFSDQGVLRGTEDSFLVAYWSGCARCGVHETADTEWG